MEALDERKTAPSHIDEDLTSPGKSATAVAAAGIAVAAAPVQATIISPGPALPTACATLINGPTKNQLLARKATFGYTTQLEADINAQGYNNWLNAQVNYTALSGWSAFETSVKNTWFIDPIPTAPELCGMDGPMRNDLVKARVARAIGSPAQLFERTVEFWSDHLNTWHYTPTLGRFKTLEDRDVIRNNAFGKLKDLLYASASGPAMLNYLNGNGSHKNAPNENYARELLELHTLGVDVCYDENTIFELARSLTGWRVKNTSTSSFPFPCDQLECGEACFDDSRHDQGAKSIIFPDCLGPGQDYIFNIAAGLSADTELGQVIFMLTDPNELGEKTVRFIATKMATYFHKCTPPDAMINEMWTAYQNAYAIGRNDIAAMVKVMLASKWISCSKSLLKRPLHLMASALRVLGMDPLIAGFNPGNKGNANYVVGGFLEATGHIPYDWPAPNGYPSTCAESYWGANQLERWNLGAHLLDNGFSGLDTAAMNAFTQTVNAFATDAEAMDFLDQEFFGGHMPNAQKSDIQTCLVNNKYSRTEAVGIVIASPGYQWY